MGIGYICNLHRKISISIFKSYYREDVIKWDFTFKDSPLFKTSLVVPDETLLALLYVLIRTLVLELYHNTHSVINSDNK